MNIDQPQKISKQDRLIEFIDYHFAVRCSNQNCGVKVIDPDKKRGQIFLKGKCPTCKQYSGLSKKDKQRLRRLLAI
jgi:hypothetical protein